MPKSKTESSPRITAGGILQEFWDIFPQSETDLSKKTFQFHLCVFVDALGLGPFHTRYEYCRDFGLPHIPSVYSGKPLPDGDLMWVFPDRWLVPRMAAGFVYALNRHPSIVKKARRRVLIVTMQPYIVGDCYRENVLIVQNPEFNKKASKDPDGEGKTTFGLEAALSMMGA